LARILHASSATSTTPVPVARTALYHGEPVPGGDDEFREDLRKLIHREVDRVPNTVDYYVPLPLPTDPDDLRAVGRQVWQRFYPDEPLP
jgi:hypothetical protein